jgi:hypothetical protein
VIGSHSIQVNTKKQGVFRIYAGENLRGGPNDKFTAIYDELTKIRMHEEQTFEAEVWMQTSIAQANGATIEKCLLRALPFINNLSLGRNTGPHKTP